MARPPKPAKPPRSGRNTNLGVMASPATILRSTAISVASGGHGDQVLLPPPPHVARHDGLGRPTKAQVDYDTRLADFSKQLAVTQDGANTRIDRLETTVGDSSAGIVHEMKVFADGQTAMAQEITTLTAHVNNNDASIMQSLTVLTDETKAYAADITTLKGNVGTINGTITTERSLRIDGDTALGTRIDNLVVSSGNNAAVIIDSEAQARISADEALGLRIDSVTATLNGVSAAVTTEETARVNADNALASQITTVAATAGDRIYLQTTAPSNLGRNEGDLWLDSDDGNKPYWWDGAAWLPATDARIPDLYALVSTETQARIAADGTKADASTVTNLAAIVGSGIAGSTITDTLNTKASQTDLTTQANRITNLDSKVGAGIAGSTITDKLNTVATDTGSNASAITTLNSTTIPNLTNRVGTLEQSGTNVANLTAAIQTATDQNSASYLWSIRGTANTVTGAITLKGGQTVAADGTKTQYSKLIIDADTDINGALSVSTAQSTQKTGSGEPVMIIDFNGGTITISD